MARTAKQTETPMAAPKAAAKKKVPPATEAKPVAREGTAKATVLAMIQHKGGATLEEIMNATEWQAHTVRGFIAPRPRRPA